MKLSIALFTSALATGALAQWGNITYVTEVVTAYTTYCPSPTIFSHAGVTYTVTEPTIITITNCPCTQSYPAPLPPPVPTTFVPPPAAPFNNGTCNKCKPVGPDVTVTVYPGATGASTTNTTMKPYTGAAAGRTVVTSAAAALAGLAAFAVLAF